MFQETEPAFTGAANVTQLGKWLGMSRRQQLVLCDVEGSPGRAYTVMRSLVYETGDDDDGAIFHLSDGSWYRAETSFVNRMTEYINEKCAPSHLPPYNHDRTVKGKQVYSEEAYNAAITGWNEDYICLDQTNISPTGASQVEPCDIYSVSNLATETATADFYHIKISTRSAHLSHLFNQGLNAIELLKQEGECITDEIDTLFVKVFEPPPLAEAVQQPQHERPGGSLRNQPHFTPLLRQKSALENDCQHQFMGFTFSFYIHGNSSYR
ncbi:DUF6119 family protein [Falsiruegeria litorea]|uniref:DUF6119 family protein n=1 Tax=Falsiruegeria litorea TaxID=1280831 RepID=UPI001BFD2688|nr:DUF6119 family protein [Falsiruegeria litorea]MBT8167609.1 TIGR04141 family sporadically distributed protein [Falsiruegeria litorea]